VDSGSCCGHCLAPLTLWFGGVAQQVEHRAFNSSVVGSIPTAPTMSFTQSELKDIQHIMFKLNELEKNLNGAGNAISLGDIVVWQDGTEIGDITQGANELIFVPRKLV
jgi:hypothetical protein